MTGVLHNVQLFIRLLFTSQDTFLWPPVERRKTSVTYLLRSGNLNLMVAWYHQNFVAFGVL